MTPDIVPGLVVLHGNRLELLRDAVVDWLGRRPLAPLETEVLLVQSNGAAEWLKMALAQHSGVCAATRVELPARFLWRSYRQVLGTDSVPSRSPMDKSTLTWRLMRLLPRLSQVSERSQVSELSELSGLSELSKPSIAPGDAPTYAPIAGFLQHGDAGASSERLLQLALRLADLYDQYQVHRSDWLAAWASGRDELSSWHGGSVPVPPEQRWQPALWRALLDELDEKALAAIRPQVHQAFMAALRSPRPLPADALPRRLVLFGTAHVPNATLHALVAMAAHSQVLLAIPNPCRFHWADIIEGRELLRAPRRRLPLRQPASAPWETMPLAAMHAHAHPLLAAWGRQGRDFMRQLDAFEDTTTVPRVDLYDEGPGDTLLAQVQAAVRDLLPLAEHPPRSVDPADRSIDFHTAHNPLREVEILHDRLLDLLAEPPGGAALNPRDIVVMVPDIEVFAPAIRAVFGQLPRSDARFIPFEVTDLRQRESNPLLQALEWLLRIDSQRALATEIFDLLNVPGIARRFGLQAADLPQLRSWAADAGVRWGLHAQQRASLGLAACGDTNSWAFGLRRMLLGYASGDGPAFEEIAPHAEIGGLQAGLLGALVDLLERLDSWWALAGAEAAPAQWGAQARALLEALIDAGDERERLTLAALQAALADWLEACDAAGFDRPVPLAVLREGWLAGVDATRSNGRFLAGGVTFCTLLPLRAVPFEVVCLLGMNDADYPRPVTRNDFDLMALPGQQRPGDRSRRDDDRYLMLEALLSARRVLHISWTGRSARDNAAQPPSVLVAQLRDYLQAGWSSGGGQRLLEQLTTEHPLQPFSRRYFEAGAKTGGEPSRERRAGANSDSGIHSGSTRQLGTWAREWRAVHEADSTEVVETARTSPTPDAGLDDAVLSRLQLAQFLRNPVKAYFRARLAVVFDEEIVTETDEVFSLSGLQRHGVIEDLVIRRATQPLADRLQRVRREGRLPLGAPGAAALDQLEQLSTPMLAAWRQAVRRWPQTVDATERRFADRTVQLRDLSDDLRSDGVDACHVAMTASKLLDTTVNGKMPPQPYKLIAAWLRMLLDAACGRPVGGLLIGADAVLQLRPVEPAAAQASLKTLLLLWREGMTRPLPVAPKTALAWLKDSTSPKVWTTYSGGNTVEGEGAEACLARLYPDLRSLMADGAFELLAPRLYGPLAQWVDDAVTVSPHEAEDD